MKECQPVNLARNIAEDNGLDAHTLVREVSDELQAEGLHLRVEAPAETFVLRGGSAAARHALGWMIERSSASEGGTPWVALRVFAEGERVVFEVPWFETTMQQGERTSQWFLRALYEQGSVFEVRGLRARLSFERLRRGPARADAARPSPDGPEREAEASPEQLAERATIAEREADLARRHAARIEQLSRDAATDLLRVFESLGGLAAAVAERDPVGPLIQAEAQAGIERVRLWLQRAEVLPFDVVGPVSGAAPRAYTLEPGAEDILAQSFEANIPLREP